MQAVFTAWTDALLPVSTYLVLAVCGACAAAWRRPERWGPGVRWLLTGLAAWAWIFTTPAVANLGVRALEGPVAARSAPAVGDEGPALIMVMASGEVSTRGGRLRARLDEAGWERLLEGVALWRQVGGTLLFAGGVGGIHNPDASLGEVMAGHAAQLGVPVSAIRVRHGASRTHDELRVAGPEIRAHAGPVWLVTSALHMPRTLRVAQRLGLRVRPHRCDYRQLVEPAWGAWLPNARGALVFADVLHEVVGLAYYTARGWA